jgi:hypothetical protein
MNQQIQNKITLKDKNGNIAIISNGRLTYQNNTYGQLGKKKSIKILNLQSELELLKALGFRR